MREEMSTVRLEPEVFRARAMIEAFRLGIVPGRWTEEFTFGREQELAGFKAWLDNTGSSAQFVIGDYGSGKTHLLSAMGQKALRAGFAVAQVAVDLHQAPLHHPKRIYAHLIRSFRFRHPVTGRVEGFRPFMAKAIEQRVWVDHLYFSHLAGNTAVPEYWEWIEAREVLARPNPRSNKSIRHLPGLYDVAGAANQYCFLLSSLGWAAREVWGLPGILLLFDEAEILEIAPGSQAEKGISFLDSLLLTAQEEPEMADSPAETGRPVGRFTSDIPFLYRIPAGLKLVFAFTSSAVLEERLSTSSPVRIFLQPLPEKTLRDIEDRLWTLYACAYRDAYPRPVQVSRNHSGSGEPARFLVKRMVEALDIARWEPSRGRAGFQPVRAEVIRFLPSSRVPFLIRFGNLTPVQEQLIEPILAGRNTAVFTPRLYGRMEGVLAPLFERAIRSFGAGSIILIVVPSRFSGEDLIRRIGPACQAMGFPATDQTVPSENGQPLCLVLTPEDLDALLDASMGWVEHLRGVVLEDFHLVSGTVRGDQVRTLLNRMATGPGQGAFSVHLISSSLSEVRRVALRELPRTHLIQSSLPRDLQAVYLSTHQDICQFIRSNDFQKVRYLFHAPEAARLAEPLIRRHAGHIPVENLARVRSSRELKDRKAQIRQMERVLVLTSSRCEEGSLAGECELTVAAEPPRSMMGFDHRLGRGDLRENRSRLVFLFQTGREREGLRVMVEGIAGGHFSQPVSQFGASAAVQQVFSFLCQKNQPVPLTQLIELLSPLLVSSRALVLLSRLRRSGWIQYRQTGWEPTSELWALHERKLLHSNQELDKVFEIWEEGGHRRLGTITTPFDQVFLLEGKTWQVLSVQRGEVRVEQYTGELKPELFAPCPETPCFSPPAYPGLDR